MAKGLHFRHVGFLEPCAPQDPAVDISNYLPSCAMWRTPVKPCTSRSEVCTVACVAEALRIARVFEDGPELPWFYPMWYPVCCWVESSVKSVCSNYVDKPRKLV